MSMSSEANVVAKYVVAKYVVAKYVVAKFYELLMLVFQIRKCAYTGRS